MLNYRQLTPLSLTWGEGKIVDFWTGWGEGANRGQGLEGYIRKRVKRPPT